MKLFSVESRGEPRRHLLVTITLIVIDVAVIVSILMQGAYYFVQLINLAHCV